MDILHCGHPHDGISHGVGDSADKVIHRGVITNMCTQTGHSGQSGVFTIFIVPILQGDVCSVLQCRYCYRPTQLLTPMSHVSPGQQILDITEAFCDFQYRSDKTRLFENFKCFCLKSVSNY